MHSTTLESYKKNVYNKLFYVIQDIRDAFHNFYPNARAAHKRINSLPINVVGRDGALVESIDFNRRVVSSTPALAATKGSLESP